MSTVIDLRRHFGPKDWQIAPRRPEAGPTLLLTWQVEPEPVDAGIPLAIQLVLAEALCSVGFCWFAADAGSGTSIGALTLRRGLSRQRAEIFRAEKGPDVLPAFDSGAHNWSMAAQWIVVSGSAAGENVILALMKTLLEQWELPADWPADVPVIVQAGVDGDAAGCHFRTSETEQELVEALHRSATTHAVGLRTVA